MNWIQVFLFFPLFVFLLLFTASLKAEPTPETQLQDDSLEKSPPAASVKSPILCDNAALTERTQLLEQALHRTLEALSVKLGHQPFDDIISSLIQGQTNDESASRHSSAEKVIQSQTVSADSSELNSTSCPQDTHESMHVSI